MANKVLMRKGDFLISGYNEYVLSKGNHVAITLEQAVFVEKNPKVNGPKVLLFTLTSTGMPQDIADEGWKELLRKEQALQDKGAAPYVEPVKPAEPEADEAPAAEAEVFVGPSVQADGNTALAEMRKHLEGFADKAELIKYVGTLGVGDVKGNWGVERIIDTVMTALESRAAV